MNMFEDYAYEVMDGQKIRIVRYMGDGEKAVIPDSIGGLPVAVIGKQSFATAEMTEAEVPEGVETIEEEAFAICDCLQQISLPSSLKKLGNGVFKGSEALEQVLFPNGNPDFFLEDGVVYSRTELALVFCPPGLKLEQFVVPPGTETISAAAFYSNRTLEYVRLPLTLKKIGSEAFLFTNAMRIIELPPSLEEISPDAFLVGSGPFAEKRFEIYAFPDTVGYRFAVQNRIPVHPLSAIVTD
ncbi:MAG: leucine-rich repeat domain-containing protein [Lachnospiraceae bacterium]|nr:leucine-rich repeat domain-containing protein [Lachnospiraceae bacterium]